MMNRFLLWLTESRLVWAIKPDGREYLERYKCANEWKWFRWLRKLLSVRFYLHRFVGGDVQEGLHDHPFSWCVTFVLCGSYIEKYVDCFSPTIGMVINQRKVKRFNWISPRKWHQVVSAELGTWTLMLCGPDVVLDNGDRKSWGFIEMFLSYALIDCDNSHYFKYTQPFAGERTDDFISNCPTGKEYRRQQYKEQLRESMAAAGPGMIVILGEHDVMITDDLPHDERGTYRPLANALKIPVEQAAKDIQSTEYSEQQS